MLHQIGLQFERKGDYHRLLVDYEQKRLQMSRDINHRPFEIEALAFCSQIQGIYLGDYETAQRTYESSMELWENTPYMAVVSLRITQIMAVKGEFVEAMNSLERARASESSTHEMIIRAGSHVVAAILHNTMGGNEGFLQALEEATIVKQLVTGESLLSQQYEMAAASQAAIAHLGLAAIVETEDDRLLHRRLALESSQSALDLFTRFGYAQIIECVSEEIFYHHSLSLAANGRPGQASQYLQRAYDEMMRKHALIPKKSPYRRMYLENIPLHVEIARAQQEGELSQAS